MGFDRPGQGRQHWLAALSARPIRDVPSKEAALREGSQTKAMSTAPHEVSRSIAGRRLLFVGKLAGMSRRETRRIIRQHGAVVAGSFDAGVDLVVVGEDGLPLDGRDELERVARRADENRDDDPIEVISETELWERLGLLRIEQHVHRLYTPAMLADLLGVEVAVIRRWHRRGLIRPVREVRRLPYFDFQEVTTARRLAEMLAAGASAKSLERQLASLSRWLPNVERPLAQLSVIVEGRELLLRQGDGLIDTQGQRRIDFDPGPATVSEPLDPAGEVRPTGGEWTSAEELAQLAGRLEDEGQLTGAVEAYRAALAAGGPDPWTCFLLAELLYRVGQTEAARERYYMAIELDENFVEARANLGCVLAETGEHELAVAALCGALKYHADFPDGHYHLARTLDDMGRADEAAGHWRRFLELTPGSPWSEEARQRLALFDG